MKKILKYANLYAIAVESLNMRVSLTDKERKIFELLRSVVREKTPNTTLRVAGGWVRDKLMGKESNDIDIAVDNMTGEAFANLVNDYMRENGMTTKNVTVVEANPDQSKHLATAMVKLFGLPIDFVNLRTETYSDSRIPEMQMGTPEEDSQRRDLTINSLFWNVNTEQIEDFVGGIEDLRAGIARTPLDPVQTFMDDPLRILRTVRFASRYGLKLDPALIEAARLPKVQQAFKDKISQERVWSELAGKKEGDKWKPGAIIGPNPTQAVQLLKQLGLMESIFDPSQDEMDELGLTDEMVPWETDQDNPHHQFDIWNHTINVVKNLVEQTKQDVREDHETYLVRNLAALLHDIGKRYKGIQGTSSKGHTSYHGHEETSGQIAEKVLTRLHAPKSIIKRVKGLIDAHLRPHMLIEQDKAKPYRKYVRDFEDWPHSIDLAIADNLGKKDFTEEQVPQEIQRYEDLRTKIQEAMPTGQTSSTNIARPITGKDLIDIGIKPGPIMGQIMSAIDEALLDNPALSRDEALTIAKSFTQNLQGDSLL
jgi:tRNA nucleotidyltransferase/poly(A) polymerase